MNLPLVPIREHAGIQASLPLPCPTTSSITPLGETTWRRQHRRFGIRQADRRRHVYVIGRTGVGKSALLENIIVSDIRAGRGVAVLDPHGDLAARLLSLVPERRWTDVVYLDPADVDHPFGLNVLDGVSKNSRPLVASWVVNAFKKLFANSWGPRLEYLLRTSLLTVLHSEGTTLLDVLRVLSDRTFREETLQHVDDPALLDFWEREFESYTTSFRQEAIAPIQNKVGAYVTHPVLRNIIGQERSTVDLAKVMNEGQVLIVNLAKGRVGEDASHLLGALIVTKLWEVALSRANRPEDERPDFNLVVDEFQNFLTGTFPDILSEARKYRLGLTLAHQYSFQLSDDVRAAVLGNVGTVIAFRSSHEDAEWLAREFAPDLAATDFLDLPKHEVYCRLLIDGVASEPFSARTLPPPEPHGDELPAHRLVSLSRLRYTRPVADIESEIAKRYGRDMTKFVAHPEPIGNGRRKKNGSAVSAPSP